jgi:hypothetical protein
MNKPQMTPLRLKYLRNIGMDDADMIQLERNAFGSMNLTKGLRCRNQGQGAELPQYFNRKAQLFKGIETGARGRH